MRKLHFKQPIERILTAKEINKKMILNFVLRKFVIYSVKCQPLETRSADD